MPGEIGVACCQLAPRLGDVEANAAAGAAAIREAAAAGAELVVLPELATCGYMLASAEEARVLAQPPDGPALGAWIDAARATGALVVAGFAERGEDGRVYDSAALLDGSGVLAVYRKTHLWDTEKLLFAPGDELPPVVDTRAGRIGLLICYDLEFPENARGLALRGAELLAVPTNWPLVARPPGERAPELLNAMAVARANRVVVAVADRVGTEHGVEWTGASAIVDPYGWPLAEAPPRVARIAARVDLARARDKRWLDGRAPQHADVLADRRPELYGAVTAPRAELVRPGRRAQRPIGRGRSGR
jgi:5-aminopentanamidase